MKTVYLADHTVESAIPTFQTAWGRAHRRSALLRLGNGLCDFGDKCPLNQTVWNAVSLTEQSGRRRQINLAISKRVQLVNMRAEDLYQEFNYL
jgi:hypothetical protein